MWYRQAKGTITAAPVDCEQGEEKGSLLEKMKNRGRDFPGGTVVKNLPPNAGDACSILGQGTRSHMHAATKSLHATTKEPLSRN